jgi:hypothetical protein
MNTDKGNSKGTADRHYWSSGKEWLMAVGEEEREQANSNRLCLAQSRKAAKIVWRGGRIRMGHFLLKAQW